MQNTQKEIAKIISLTFDSNPQVRINAARRLADSNDPATLLALLELAKDKNKEVAKVANEILEKTKQNKPDMLPLAELFKDADFSGGPKSEEVSFQPMGEEEIRRKEMMLDPIQKAFEKSIGKENAEQLKPKLAELAFKHPDKTMFQNLLTQVLGFYGGSKEEKKKTEEETVEQAVAITQGEHKKSEQPKQHPKESKPVQQQAQQSASQPSKFIPAPAIQNIAMAEEKDEDAEEIGKEAQLVNVDDLFSEEEKKIIEEGDPSIIKQAYDSMLISEGNEAVIEHQAATMKKYLNHQVDVAFKLAVKKFKEVKLTDIAHIKNGMKNITTDVLLVKRVEQKQYSKTKLAPKEIYTRVTVVDPEGKEGIVYLFEGRGKFIAEGMNLYLEKAKSKTFKFSGETVLTVDNKRGKVYAVF